MLSLNYHSIHPIKEGDKLAIGSTEADGVVVGVYNNDDDGNVYHCTKGVIEVWRNDGYVHIIAAICNFKSEVREDSSRTIIAVKGRYDVLHGIHQ